MSTDSLECESFKANLWKFMFLTTFNTDGELILGQFVAIWMHISIISVFAFLGYKNKADEVKKNTASVQYTPINTNR